MIIPAPGEQATPTTTLATIVIAKPEWATGSSARHSFRVLARDACKSAL
ncbi:hypothetical protein [Streptomyces sp. NBC_00887]|nr:hypothetical protein OG844_27715 [Streptomyces sp. NBC_00887]